MTATHPPDMDDRSEEQLSEEIVQEVREGVDGTGIRPGIIGEIGCSWPLHPNERKVLRASARAQLATGVPISIHPGFNQAAPFEILAILLEAERTWTGVVMGHIERCLLDRTDLLKLARMGSYLEYDLFGQIRPSYPRGGPRTPRVTLNASGKSCNSSWRDMGQDLGVA